MIWKDSCYFFEKILDKQREICYNINDESHSAYCDGSGKQSHKELGDAHCEAYSWLREFVWSDCLKCIYFDLNFRY